MKTPRILACILAMIAMPWFAARAIDPGEATPSEPGLLFHFDFERAGDGEVHDAGGSGWDAVVAGARQVSGGVRGSAMRFNGVGDCLRFRNHPELSSREFSVTAWVYPEDLPRMVDAGIAGKHGEHNNRSYFWIYAHEAQLCATMIGNRTGQFQHLRGGLLSDRRWTFVALTYDGAIMNLFANGRLAGMQAVEGYQGNGYDMLIGAGELNYQTGLPQRFWRGCIDEVRYYKKCISDEDVQKLYARDAGGAGNQPPARSGEAVAPAAVPVEAAIATNVSPDMVRRLVNMLTRDQRRQLFGSEMPAIGMTPELTRIRFSNSPDGDQDVTVFKPGEVMHIWVRDVNVAASVTGTTVRVAFVQEPETASDAPVQKLIDLDKKNDDIFTGKLSLEGTHPGRATVSVLGVAPDGSRLYRIAPLLLVP